MHRTTKRLAALAIASLATCLALPAAQASPGSPIDVQVLSITDFHGYLQPPSPTAGDGGTIPDGNGGRRARPLLRPTCRAAGRMAGKDVG